MENYFANIDYIKDKKDIPIKYDIIRHAPENIYRWYINKFNPYLMEKAYICDCPGYNIGLPILKEEGACNQALILKTLEDLYDGGVRVLNFSENFDFLNDLGFFRPQGDLGFIFMIKEVFLRTVKYTCLDLKYADVCIIGDDNFYTKIAVEAIYPEVNYLTVLVPSESHGEFNKTAEKIFADTGLYIQVAEKGDVSSADIIINTSEDRSYDYSYKRGLIYIEPPSDKKRFNNLLLKREDIFAVNNCTVALQDSILTSKDYETYLYLKNPSFRRLVSRRYSALKEGFEEISIEKYNAKIKHIYRNNYEMSKFNLKKYLIKAGL